jgi:hypothetical protein
MGTDPFYEKLQEISWRRKLTSAEERDLREWLAAHPEVQETIELESGLTEVLAKMPNVPVASNFTARVLQAVEREAMAGARTAGSGWKLWKGLPRWVPRVASATLVVTAAGSLYLYNQSAQARQQRELVQRVARVQLPSPEILTNFDAIRIVSTTPAPDEQLLALFQ